MRWHPEGVKRGYGSERPELGDVVAYDMRAWTVEHIKEVEPTPEEAGRWTAATLERRPPYAVTLRRLHGRKYDWENDRQEVGLRISAMSYHHWSTYEEARVPLCSCCGDPWPCMTAEAKKASEQQAEILNAKMDRSVPGCCYSCGEVISHRQGSVTYPEPNVELIGYPAPRFHTRNACAEGWYQYEKKRAKALPDAPSLYEMPSTDALWGAS